MDIKLPNLGEGADSGVVVSILVNVGDQIDDGQNIIELETGKAVASIPATGGGKIEKIHVKVGDKIAPGAAILTVSGTSAKTAEAPPAEKPRPAEPRKSTPAAPVEEEAEPEEDAMPEPTVESTESHFAPPASPSIRKLARDLGLDLRRIKGSEHGGRIVMADLRKYIQGLIRKADKAASAAKPAAPAQAAPVSIDFSQWGEVSRQPMSPLRQVVARRMVESSNTCPQVTQFEETDLTALLALRKKYVSAYEAKGARLTLTGFAILALVDTLKKHPMFNASLDEATQEIVLKKYHHIGIAVDTPAGLMVPVIRNADQKSLLDLSLELGQIAEKARDRKLTQADMQGGSCTISNQGAIGGWHFTPIINKPECAILGLGKAALKPAIVAGGKIEPRSIMPVTLTYDHRLIDGANAARFVVDLRQVFENFSEDWIRI